VNYAGKKDQRSYRCKRVQRWVCQVANDMTMVPLYTLHALHENRDQPLNRGWLCLEAGSKMSGRNRGLGIY